VERRQEWLAIVVLLLSCTAFVSWFDYAALTALIHPARDAAGNTQFQVLGYSNQVYPFTYVGVLLSGIGIAYFVYREERLVLGHARAALLGLVIANLASVGMIDIYEQAWLGGGYFIGPDRANSSLWFSLYWGTAGGFGRTLGGVLIAFSILPWSKRRNFPGVLLCGGVVAAAFLTWYANGFGGPASGNILDYSMNASSRIASQLVLVAAVSSVDFLTELKRIAGAIRRLSRRGDNQSPKGSQPG
jgi:hypothetical protein